MKSIPRDYSWQATSCVSLKVEQVLQQHPYRQFVLDMDTQSEQQAQKQSLVTEARKMVSLFLEAVETGKQPTKKHESSLGFSKNSLKAFASSESITVEIFRGSGGLRSIVIGVKKHCAESDVVEYGCGALGALTLYDTSTVIELVKVGAIDSIIMAIATQAEGGTDDALVSALKTLRNLTQTEENRTTIFKASGIEAVVKAMAANGDYPRTLSHGALVLSNLAFGNQIIKEAVGNLGGVAAIAKGMKDHRDFQAMQARGSLALRNLCYQSEDNQKVAGENDAAKTLLATIGAYNDDREVVHQSCVALANLSSRNEENRLRIVEAGGVSTLVKLMQTYTESSTVNDDCISIIRNIAVGSSEAQLEIGLSGGVACICAAMDKFQKSEKIADKACTALRYLCFLSENRDRIRELQGIEAIINALRRTNDSSVVLENALLAIGNATFGSEESKAIVGRCGGISAIITAIEQHRLNAGIQEHGCRVLRNLADGCELNRRLQAENGGVNTAVFAMMGYPDNASVQEQACAMLLNMSFSTANLERLEHADVHRLAEKAVNLHTKHRGVQLQAGTLLDRLNGYDVTGSGETRAAVTEHQAPSNNHRRGLRNLFHTSSFRRNARDS